MRTAILAGGIAVVRSSVGCVEGGEEVLMLFWRLGYKPDSVEEKKTIDLSEHPCDGLSPIFLEERTRVYQARIPHLSLFQAVGLPEHFQERRRRSHCYSHL